MKVHHLYLLVLLTLPTVALAHTITGRVTRVIDGDTVVVKDEGGDLKPEDKDKNRQVRVRLADIDAPEMKQPYGREAKAALVNMVMGKRVTATYTCRDRYGRLLATLHYDLTNINLAMVQGGHAWRYKYAKKTGPIAQAEARAKENAAGLWREIKVLEPWEHRQK